MGVESSVPFVRAELSFNDDPLARTSLALWVAGCPRKCQGCQNPELQDPSAGVRTSLSGILKTSTRFLSSDLVESVVYLGGDWCCYWNEYTVLANEFHNGEFRLENVLYTGELWEKIPRLVQRVSDWVIDGPWDESQRGVFPSSRNQRVFHLGVRVDPIELPLYRKLQGSVKHASTST